MGIKILTEEEDRMIQEPDEFGMKTFSWLVTPPAIRTLGGAIFGDRRHGRVFVFQNRADTDYG